MLIFMIMLDSQQNYPSKIKKFKDFSEKHTKQKYSPGAEGDFSQETKLKTEEPFDMASQQRMIQLLKTVREPIAEFQERRGISKQETFTFPQLLKEVCQKIYTVVMIITNMVMNLFPLIDAFLLIIRFILDKAIECAQATNNDKYIKTGVFVLEFVALLLMTMTMLTLIVAPLYMLFGHILSKIWNAIV